MADLLMYIPNDETQNYPSCRLKLKNLNKPKNEPTKNSIKVDKPINKKRLL